MNSRAEHKSSRRLRSWAGTVAIATSLAPFLVMGTATADSTAAALEKTGQIANGFDWAPVVERALHCLKPRPEDTWYVVRARVAAVGDLTGDGKPETVVVSSCPSPTSGNPVISFVYDGAAKRSAPRLIGALGKNRYFKSQTVTIQKAQVHLRGKVVSSRAANCCPDLIVRQTYKWNGAKFLRTSEKSTRIS
ncbi:hypothetical protein AB0F17_24465 [Nonomuraea sp. NPDC026600]|uniref:hypothetical protein n=1 Tax=Nonomuraea sp. NPDC026600 TaxID=3155363 RepID=UPI0033E075D4